MSKLTTRSKITVRYTTNPADMGYDGVPSAWMTEPGEVMSLSKALEFSYELGQRIGQGTNRLISYRNQGREVSLDEIRDVLWDAECRKEGR